MNMFNILTKLANIAGNEEPKSLKEWGGDPADLEDPSSQWYQGPKGAPDRDPDDAHSDMIEAWTDAVETELAHYQIDGQLSDDQIDDLAGDIANDLNAPHEVVLQIIQGTLSEKDNEPDIDMGQEYGDDFDESQGDQGDTGAHGEETISPVHGESMEQDLTMESLRVLSGLNKTIAECGIPTAMMGGSHTPASINITAGSGPELTGMLKDIMNLAGVNKAAEPVHQPIDVLATPDHVDHMPKGPDMAALIRAVDEPEADRDSMNDEPENEGMPEKTENRPWDSSPHEKERQDGVRKFGDQNSGDHRERQAGLARAKPTTEDVAASLFAEYKKFVSEGKIDDLKDRQAEKKEADADKYKDTGSNKKDSARTVKGRSYGSGKDKDEEVDESQLNELSPRTLGNYASKARGEANWARGVAAHGSTSAQKSDKFNKLADKRTAGANKAEKKVGMNPGEAGAKAHDWVNDPKAPGGAQYESSYSAKKAAAGKDIGKPGKNFAKIAKSAGKEYGSKEKGEKVAGAVLKNLRAKK